MKAMILAAGRGERLRPLTDTLPKPLIPLRSQPLIVYHLERLQKAGFKTVWINTAWLGDLIEKALGNGAAWDLDIHYSHEGKIFGRSLETAGGIAAIAAELGSEPFLVLNGDILCDFDLNQARKIGRQIRKDQHLAHLVLVDNPPHHPAGDFYLSSGQKIATTPEYPGVPRFTFSGIGIYDPMLFKDCPIGMPHRLADLLHLPIEAQQITGSHHGGYWFDIGTAERLDQAHHFLQQETL